MKCTYIVASSPGHTQLLMFHIRKLGVAWERGYMYAGAHELPQQDRKGASEQQQ